MQNLSSSLNTNNKILHLDGDAFFASVEIAKNPKLHGKPVVVGGDRSIVTALSYEAKALGVARGMPIFQVKRLCPQVVVLPTDFHSYSLFSKRMIAIVRRYVSIVEEYSIDECFADMSEFSYEECVEIMDKISQKISAELDITVSLGLAPNKVLAKVASKWQKPKGKTIIGIKTETGTFDGKKISDTNLDSGQNIEHFLSKLSVGKLWGIGGSTANLLGSLGVRTALDFANLNKALVENELSAPHKDIWRELHGEYVMKVNPFINDELPKSISRTSTFRPFTSNIERLLTELSRHAEEACAKARELKLFASKFSFFIKSKEFQSKRVQVELKIATNLPSDIMLEIRKIFYTDQFFTSADQLLWRATGVTLFDFAYDSIQKDLFGDVDKYISRAPIFNAVDFLNSKFGTGTVILASSLGKGNYSHINEIMSEKKHAWGAIQTDSFGFMRLPIPYMGEIS